VSLRVGDYTRAPMEWQRRNAPIFLLGAALLAAGALLLALGSGLTFFQDTWAFLLDRQDSSARAFLMPHNEHIAVIPVALQKLELALFGMTTAAPERVALVLAVLISATLLFVYVRRRLGPWPALIAAVLLLFLGPAWADLLWGFQIAFVGSVLFGIAMLLALDRGDRRGDIAACVFLTLSVGFSSLGLSFVAAAAADVVLRRRTHGLKRAYLVAIPAFLYATWWVGWGHEAERHITLENILASPAYLLEGMATAVEALLGLNKSSAAGSVPPVWGVPILVVLIALVVYRQIRRPGFSPHFWPVAAAAATNWLLAAFNFIPGREAYQGRYLYAGGVFILLLATELLRGVRFGRRGLIVAGAVAVMAVASNLVPLHHGSTWLKEQTVLTRSDLAAMEIASRTIPPEFSLGSVEVSGTASLALVNASLFFEAKDRWGSPAYSDAELEAAPETGRHYADLVLAAALPVSTVTRPGAFRAAPPGGERCVVLPGGAASQRLEVPLSSSLARIELAPGPHAAFSLRRFAVGEFPVLTPGAAGESLTLLRIPRDNASQRWYLHVEAQQRARVCD
jgi:hypothetical protein